MTNNTNQTNFPIETLPKELQETLNALKKIDSLPFEVTGTIALGIMSLAAQGHANIQTDRYSRPLPISDFFMILAPTGAGKSSALSRLNKGLKAFEEKKGSEFKNEQEIFKFKLNRWEIDAKKIDDADDFSDHVTMKPQPPLPVKTYLEKCSSVGLFQHMEKTPVAGILTSEGGNFFNSWSFQGDGASNQSRELMNNLTSLYSGEGLDRNIGGESNYIGDGKRFSFCMLIQKSVAQKILSDTYHSEQGILPRFLITDVPYWEEQPISFDDVDDSTEMDKIDAFNDRILELLEKPLKYKPDSKVEIDPRTINLSDGAKHSILTWNNNHILPIENKSGFEARLKEHAYRLAGIMAVYCDHKIVEQSDMETAIALVEYYYNQRKTLSFDDDVDDRDTRDVKAAESVHGWLLKQAEKDGIEPIPISRIRSSVRALKKNLDVETRILHLMTTWGMVELKHIESSNNKKVECLVLRDDYEQESRKAA